MLAGCLCTFRVTPFDVGRRILKSDRYLQFAESAQLDFGLRSGLLARMRSARCAWVNVEQQITFIRPIRLFDKVVVSTSVKFADAKFVHVQHEFFVSEALCASVLVKAKFKAGRMTVSACELTRPMQALPPG